MKIISLFTFLFFLACGGNSSSKGVGSNDYSMSKEAVLETPNASVNSQSPAKVISGSIQRKLIKRGDISFETDDLSKTKKNISEAVKKYGGYIANENEYKSSHRISNSITVRIPSIHFDGFLADISADVTKFDSKNISVNDVTEEFLDVQARLKVKKALEERYSELLKKAKSVKEILEVERELTNVRSSIESMQGRLKYLQNQVSFSTLKVNFYKVEIVRSSEDNFWRRLAQAFNNGISNIKWFFIGLINIWPFIILIILIYFIIKKRIKK